MGLLIFWFFVSIVFSFLCSVWEAVLLSVTPAYVQVKVQEGSAIGHKLQEFKKNIDKPLAAILTLNTIAHTAGAIGVGAQATEVWKGNAFVTGAVVPVVMTLAILILSEIIPKTWGANYWQKLAPFTVSGVGFITKLLFPLVWLSQIITKNLKKEKGKSVLSRSEFAAMAKVGEQSGIFQEGESRILENLMKFNTIQVQNIMTPRTVVLAEQEETTIQEFHEKNKELRFSRIPIYTENKDQISGFVMKDDLLDSIINDKGHQKLKDISREIPIVNENMLLLKLFDALMEKKNHIALVVDEFGGMSGIVTMEDLIETLLGMEIVDEFDGTEDMQALARKKWQERATKLGILPADLEK